VNFNVIYSDVSHAPYECSHGSIRRCENVKSTVAFLVVVVVVIIS
jgi:hypothetical protein